MGLYPVDRESFWNEEQKEKGLAQSCFLIWLTLCYCLSPQHTKGCSSLMRSTADSLPPQYVILSVTQEHLNNSQSNWKIRTSTGLKGSRRSTLVFAEFAGRTQSHPHRLNIKSSRCFKILDLGARDVRICMFMKINDQKLNANDELAGYSVCHILGDGVYTGCSCLCANYRLFIFRYAVGPSSTDDCPYPRKDAPHRWILDHGYGW